MKKKTIKLFSLILFFVVGPAVVAMAADKQIVGWVEIASIYPGNLKIKAKLDTGAENSSLNAKNIEYLERVNQTWVRFDIRNFKGRVETVEAVVTRIAQIKRHGGQAADRPVITLGICLGSTYKEVEVNLTDRTGFNYQMLIGRSFLKGSFLIDPELTFLSQPQCNGPAEK